MTARSLRRLVSLGAVASIAALSAEARADGGVTQGEGFDTHLFRPAMDSKGFFATNGSDILGHTDMSFGLIIDYGRSILRQDADYRVGRTNHLISNSFQGTFQFNFGLFNHVVVGLDLPINLMAGDPQSDGTPKGWDRKAFDGQNLGYIGLHAKWRVTRVEKGFGFAVGLRAGVPVTDSPLQAGADPGFYVWPELIGEKRFGATGKFKIGINAGFRAHAASSTVITPLRDNTTFKDGQRITYGLGLSYRATDSLDLVLDTYATYLLSDASPDLKLSNEVTGGIKLFVDRNSYFMLGGGSRYTSGFEAADGRAFIGFIFEPSIGDRDGDGYKDDVDQCPDQPEDFDGFKDEDGCPDPDNDNDGILDVDDRCPNEPEDRDGDHDEDGCPEGNDGDRDGDGILDSRDKCPDVPEDRDGFQDQDGCPDPDNDMDGIPDKKDQCPNDAEDKDGFEDEDGCPDPDNDKDGIPDVKDKCPNEPETFNGFEDEDGCPDKGSVIIQGNDILILQKIKFKTASAEILPESNAILDAVSTTLIHHPEFLLIEIAGHADERAPDDYNLRLTQDRVNSVVAAVISRGVEKARVRSKGYGEYCPEDPAHNDAAWETNRRVEFKIVKTKDGPTGVELGCQNARTHGVNPDPVP
jgi:outer membrane protein OmpA-like peptidoglycan-associated protein